MIVFLSFGLGLLAIAVAIIPVMVGMHLHKEKALQDAMLSSEKNVVEVEEHNFILR